MKTKQIIATKDYLKLISYISRTISYGYIGKHDNQRYSQTDNSSFNSNIKHQYYLQTPEQLQTSKTGICWDIAEFARDWFDKQKYYNKVYFLIYMREQTNNLPTHTFLVFKRNSCWYWFEGAWEAYKGVHKYASLGKLIKDVKQKHHEDSEKYFEADKGDFEKLTLFEVIKPNFGCGFDEYIIKYSETIFTNFFIILNGQLY